MSGSITDNTASMSLLPKPSYAVRSLSVSSLKRRRAYMFGGCRGPGFCHGCWFASEVTLGEVDSVATEQTERCVVAHELRDGLLSEPVRDLDDRFHGQLVRLRRGQLADEVAVDLQIVERQVLQVVERAEASAEVVECECAAELAEALGEAARLLDVHDRRRFGDL